MNTTGRYMRIAGALVVLLMVSFSIYYNFFHHSVTRDVDKILDDMGKEMVNELFVKPCRDPASDECRQILEFDAVEGSCDYLERSLRTSLSALAGNRPRTDKLRRDWSDTEALIRKKCPVSPGSVNN